MPVFGPGPNRQYSVGSVFSRIYDLLLGTTREEIAQLTLALDNEIASVQLSFATVVTPGTILSIDDELIYVWGVTPSSNGVTCNVQRGYRDTTPTTHDALALVLINPYFSAHEVRECMRDEIRSWPPQVFQVKTVEIQAENFVEGYDLGDIDPWLHPLKCQISPNTLTPGLDDLAWDTVPFLVDQSANLTDFPSGNSLTITAPGGIYQAPQTIHFKYAAPFDVDTIFTDTTDLVAVVGIDESDIDIVIYGASWRLVQGFEVRRNLFNPMQTSGDYQGVPPGSILREADYYKQERDSRLGDAQRRLRGQYPVARR
jgi:hypothetical protein